MTTDELGKELDGLAAAIRSLQKVEARRMSEMLFFAIYSWAMILVWGWRASLSAVDVGPPAEWRSSPRSSGR